MTTLFKVLYDYQEDLRVRGKVTTQRTARSHCGTISRVFGSMDATLVSRATVNTLVTELRLKGLSDSSINGCLRTLRAALRLAGLSPVVKLLNETRKIPAVLERRHIENLMACAPGPDERLAIAIAAFAGLRHQEIAHLTWDDVDWQNRVLFVRSKNGWTPKAHAERAVPICDALWAAFACHETAVGRSRPLFAAREFTEGIRQAFQAAGLYTPGTKPGLHMLRRTFASRLLSTGSSIEAVRELGGWADLKTVQRYLAATDDEKRAAVGRL